MNILIEIASDQCSNIGSSSPNFVPAGEHLSISDLSCLDAVLGSVFDGSPGAVVRRQLLNDTNMGDECVRTGNKLRQRHKRLIRVPGARA